MSVWRNLKKTNNQIPENNTMSEGSLIPQDCVGGALAPEGSFDSIVSSGDYLPYLQLFGSKSDACAQGKIGIGHYGLVKDKQITDISPEVDLVIVSWRPKAVQSGDEFLVDFHPEIVDGEITNTLFKKIVDLSNVRDSGCMYGPEFLLWIPSANTFATYHMNSKTGRREARNMQPLIGKAATLKCHLIEQGKYKWHGPLVIPCSSPLDMPPEDEIREQYAKFQNPPRNEMEVADDNDTRAR